MLWAPSMNGYATRDIRMLVNGKFLYIRNLSGPSFGSDFGPDQLYRHFIMQDLMSFSSRDSYSRLSMPQTTFYLPSHAYKVPRNPPASLGSGTEKYRAAFREALICLKSAAT